MSRDEQFTGLDLKSLISGPLDSIADSQINLSQAYVQFVNELAFSELENDPDGLESKSRKELFYGSNHHGKLIISNPMFKNVSVPNLEIDEKEVNFDMEVKNNK